MSAKGDVFENDLAKLIFQGTAIANLADNAATAPLTSLYVALHTADPGEAGNQQTSEVSYTGYARKAVARSAGGFTVTGNTVTLAADVVFDPCTGGSATATHASIGTAASGAGKVLYRGPLSPNIAISNGVTPRVPAAGSAVTED